MTSRLANLLATAVAIEHLEHASSRACPLAIEHRLSGAATRRAVARSASVCALRRIPFSRSGTAIKARGGGTSARRAKIFARMTTLEC